MNKNNTPYVPRYSYSADGKEVTWLNAGDAPGYWMHPDQNELVRELDVALNGADGAAPQASLCDLVAQAKKFACEHGHPFAFEQYRIKDGDVVILQPRQMLTTQQFVQLESHLKQINEKLKHHVEFVVVGNNMNVHIIRSHYNKPKDVPGPE